MTKQKNKYSQMRVELIQYGFDLLQTKEVLKSMHNGDDSIEVGGCLFLHCLETPSADLPRHFEYLETIDEYDVFLMPV